MLKVRSHCSRLLVNRLPPPPMPALLNSRWIRSVFCCSASSSRKRLNWSSIDTSAMWVVTRRPCGSFSTSHSRLVSAMASAETSHIATLQPSATSWRASSRPMPVPPPVMTAIFPAKSFIDFHSLVLLLVDPLLTQTARSAEAKMSDQPSPVRGLNATAVLLRRLDAPVPERTQSLQRCPDRSLLCDGSLRHRCTGISPCQSLQGLGVLRTSRQIVRDQRVPEHE